MPSIEQEIQATLDLYKSSPPPQIGMLSPDVAKAWTVSSGIVPYNLVPTAQSFFPQLTPWRNSIPRDQGKGKQVEYLAVTALNTGNASPFVAEGSLGTAVSTTVADVIAAYKSLGLSDSVTYEAQWAGQGLDDIKGRAVVNLLRALMIAEENVIGFGQLNGSAVVGQQSPGASGASPKATFAVSGADGSITAATFWIKQTVVTGQGESTASATTPAGDVAVGANNHITITPVFPASQPVIGFKYYWSATSTGTFSEILAADIVGGAASLGTLPGGSLIWTTNGTAINVKTLTTGNAAPPGSDTTGSSLAFNGIYPQMWMGCPPTNLVKVNGTLAMSNWNALCQAMWQNAKADPDGLWVHAQESVKLTAIAPGAGAPYYVMVDNQNAATANFRVARLVNPVTGSEVPVRVHPTMPQGTALALSTKLPGWYVPTGIKAPIAMDLPQDYTEIDYPPTSSSPKWTLEIRAYGTLKLHIPPLMGAMYAINNS